MPTLTTQELLLDVIDAFVKQLPILPHIGRDWRPASLKLDQTYTAHVPTIPSVEDVSSGNYAGMTGNNARSLLTDLPVVVNKHIGTLLKWQHINAIKDQKNEYEKVIALAGYALAKSVVDDIVSALTPVTFSQSSRFSVANSDCDMLDDICGNMNTVGAYPTGRYGIVNTSVANVLAADSRLTSADYAGQRVRGNGYRRWTDVNGFAEIMEYPDLSNTTSGTQLTGVTCANSGDLFTKANHNLVTGQSVTLASFSAGITGGAYFVIRVTANTFQVADSYDNAIAGTAAAVSADGTGGTVTPTQTLTGFFADPRAITLLAGIPDGMDTASTVGVNVNRINSVETVTHPDHNITMAMIAWEGAGTLDVNLVPTFVYGKALGRQTDTGAPGAPGAICDYAGHRLTSA